MQRKICLGLSRVFVFLFLASNHAFGQPVALPPLMELELDSRLERGIPIAWHADEVVLLRTDGSIEQYATPSIRRHSILPKPFHSETAMEIRGQLLNEFSRNYSVGGSDDFVIVAPHESLAVWSERFAQLQRSFVQYFATRGFPLKPSDFPLVGIVFRSQAEYLAHAQKIGVQISPNTVGYYSPVTNRLYAFEMSGFQGAELESLATIWHEAAHQIAFNRGIHQRLSSPPLWMLEGLASIFEAPGLFAPRSTISPADLINRSRWERWKTLSRQTESMAQSLESLFVTDDLFKINPEDAYTIAWGVSLYLSERDTKNYHSYLRKLSQLEVGAEYPAGQRLADVRQSFSGSPLTIIKAADRYLKGLQ